MFNFIKNHKKSLIISAIIILTLTVGSPVIIHILFKIHPRNPFFVAVWSAGDMLNYCASVFSFLATILLSGLALWQTHKIKLESDKHDLQIAELERKRIKPYIVLEPGVDKAKGQIEITLSNMSFYVAKDLMLFDFTATNANGEDKWKSEQRFEVKHLVSDGIICFLLVECPDMVNGDKLIFTLQYADIYGNVYKFHIIGEYLNKSIVFSDT